MKAYVNFVAPILAAVIGVSLLAAPAMADDPVITFVTDPVVFETYYQEWFHDYDQYEDIWEMTLDFPNDGYGFSIFSPCYFTSLEWPEPGALSAYFDEGPLEIDSQPGLVTAMGGYFGFRNIGTSTPVFGDLTVEARIEGSSYVWATYSATVDAGGQFICAISDTPGVRLTVWNDNGGWGCGKCLMVDGLVVGEPALYGDANHDGIVDISDLTVLSLNWEDASEAKTWEQGDFNGNGYVDISDLTILSGHWTPGSSSYSEALASIGTVPEPATFAMLIAGLVGLVAYAWRKR